MENYIGLLGKSWNIYLCNGETIYFRVFAVGPDWITGYNDEGLKLKIPANDIERIMEVR